MKIFKANEFKVTPKSKKPEDKKPEDKKPEDKKPDGQKESVRQWLGRKSNMWIRRFCIVFWVLYYGVAIAAFVFFIVQCAKGDKTLLTALASGAAIMWTLITVMMVWPYNSIMFPVVFFCTLDWLARESWISTCLPRNLKEFFLSKRKKREEKEEKGGWKVVWRVLGSPGTVLGNAGMICGGFLIYAAITHTIAH